jgi:hypothetical protein
LAENLHDQKVKNPTGIADMKKESLSPTAEKRRLLKENLVIGSV